jgi:hypothetical protein
LPDQREAGAAIELTAFHRRLATVIDDDDFKGSAVESCACKRRETRRQLRRAIEGRNDDRKDVLVQLATLSRGSEILRRIR